MTSEVILMSKYVTETVKEKIIGGKKVTVIVRANVPSPEAIKRCAETMARIVVQVEEREKQKE
jgi:hypothetical protein